jgi:hypothetical protein
VPLCGDGLEFPLDLCETGLHLAPFLDRLLASLGGLLATLIGDLEVSLQALDLDARLAEVAFELVAPRLGCRALLRSHFTRSLGFGERAAKVRHPGSELVSSRAETCMTLLEAREIAPRQRHHDGEALHGVCAVPFRASLLPRQAPHLGLHFTDHVVEALEVGCGALESPLRRLLAVSVQADPGGLLEEGAPFLGPIGQEAIDHLGFHHDAGVAPQPRSLKQVRHVSQPDGGLVEQVLALTGARESPGQYHLAVGYSEEALAVVEDERDFGNVDRVALDGTLKDHFVHAGRPEQARPLLAKHPSNGVGDVRLAASVGAHDGRDAVVELQGNAIGKRLESRQFEPGEPHGRSPVPVVTLR